MFLFKKIGFCLLSLLFVLSATFASEKNIVTIYLPKTLSSIPLLELNNLIINQKLVKTDFFQDHIITMAEFINGKIDILMTGFTQGVSAAHENNEIVLAVTPVWGVSLLVTNNPQLTGLKNFIGKKILVPFAKSPLELQMQAILKKENLLDQIQLDYASIQQAIPLLITKQADGICIPEPQASKLIFDQKAYKVFLFSEMWGKINNGEKRSPQVSLFVKKDFFNKNAKFIAKLIEALNTKIIEMKENPEVYLTKYESIFDLKMEVLKMSWQNILLEIPPYLQAKKISIDFLKVIDIDQGINNNFFIKY